MAAADSFSSRSTLDVGGKSFEIFRIDALAEHYDVAKLPYTLRVLLENVLRREDGQAITRDDVEAVATWVAADEPSREISFTPARVLLQDFTGVPAIVDLAAMRDANASTCTEWSITSSAGISGLIFDGSPPRSAIASLIAARSTIAGTPVKS